MKKLGICLVFFVLGTFCFAQSNTDAQRIVGNWRGKLEHQTVTFNFNANGILTLSVEGESENWNYFLSGSSLIIKIEDNIYISDYYLSPNGRILVFSIDRLPLWLEKQ